MCKHVCLLCIYFFSIDKPLYDFTIKILSSFGCQLIVFTQTCKDEK